MVHLGMSGASPGAPGTHGSLEDGIYNDAIVCLQKKKSGGGGGLQSSGLDLFGLLKTFKSEF